MRFERVQSHMHAFDSTYEPHTHNYFLYTTLELQSQALPKPAAPESWWSSSGESQLSIIVWPHLAVIG